LALLTCSASVFANAQTAHFSDVQSTIGSVGEYEPGGVAVDASGNVYIVDQFHGVVYKETPSAAGIYVQSTVVAGLSSPHAVAVDPIGNVYVVEMVGASYPSYTVLVEKPSGSGYIESTVVSGLVYVGGLAVDSGGNVYIAEQSGYFLQGTSIIYQAGSILKESPTSGGYSQSVIVSNPNYPQGIAVDGSGNVYYVDSAIMKETPSAGGYTQSTLFTVPNAIGIAVDSGGDLYIAAPSSPTSSRVLKETFSGGNWTETAFGSDLNYSDAVAVDGSGNVYISDAFNSRVLKETPSGGNFGTVNVGSPSTKMSWIFTFDTAGTIGVPVVLTQGSTGLDFADAGTGNCTTNGTTFEYNIGDTCMVDVVFTPTTSGTRNGSVELVNNSGTVIATGSAQGVGQASGVTRDFTITSPGSGTPSVTASAGGQAVYPFVISPTGSTGMPGSVSLSVTGLPTGATAAFSPSTISAGAATTNVILVVTVPVQSTAQSLPSPLRGGALPVAFALILLPFAGKWRKAARRMNSMTWIAILGLCSIGMVAGLTGCGGSGSSKSSAQTYSLTVTATSGSLSHTTTATLIVN
jgi:hypothetical protein